MREERTRWRRPTRGRRNLVRIDSSTVGEETPATSKEGDLQSLFRACARLALRERREDSRVIPAERRGWLGWRYGASAFEAEAVEIVNLSKGGAMVLSADDPPRGQPVWLCLGHPGPTEGLRSEVIEVSDAGRGRYRIRVAFRDPCPEHFYITLVTGQAPVYEEEEPPASLEEVGSPTPRRGRAGR